MSDGFLIIMIFGTFIISPIFLGDEQEKNCFSMRMQNSYTILKFLHKFPTISYILEIPPSFLTSSHLKKLLESVFVT